MHKVLFNRHRYMYVVVLMVV